MKLNRANLAAQTDQTRAVAQERIVHIGLGAFARAHQAWYTSQVDAQGEWGIVAFTGRSAEVANQLSPQDGLYTLITRGAEGDSIDVIDSLSRVCHGGDWHNFRAAVVNPATAIVTLTITEAGYRVLANGRIDTTDAVVGDDLLAIASEQPQKLQSALARLAFALNQRRLDSGLGLALVSCDNLPANGSVLQNALTDWFASFGKVAVEWLESKVSFVSTSVDRITPRTTAADIAQVAEQTGRQDASPVVTEPFSSWILEGEFPLGRPAWQNAGAEFVSDIQQFENRKLWLLNGSHSLLAYAGQLLGHSTVAQGIADLRCRQWVEEFWNEAQNSLNQPELKVADYRAALVARFENARIEHRLAQIAADGATKLRVRVAPVALNELANGRTAEGCATVIAAWIGFVLDRWKSGFSGFQDSQLASVVQALESAQNQQLAQVQQLVNLLEPKLAASTEFTELVASILTANFQATGSVPLAN